MRDSYYKAILSVCLVLGFCLCIPVSATAAGIPKVFDHNPSSAISVYDKSGNLLSILSHGVTKGDYLITYDNRGWKIESVKGNRAYAKFDKLVDLNEDEPNQETLGSAVNKIWAKLTSAIGIAKEPPVIGIYHTHSDESYQPTSGTASENRGDIYQIGAALKTELEKKGFKVIQSMNNHNPHDAAAYTRSRRTVMELSRYRPVALIDVHRDAIPNAGFYKKQVSGEEIAATRIVVGKQNASNDVNFQFAKRIKASADKKHPGLVREIFWGHGNYNQDVGPKTILLEFGTHTNPEYLAKKGADLMADVLPTAIVGRDVAGPAGGPGGVQAFGNNSGWRTLLIVLGVVAAAVVGFIAMNRGGVEFLKRGGSSAANFLGRLNRGKRRAKKK